MGLDGCCLNPSLQGLIASSNFTIATHVLSNVVFGDMILNKHEGVAHELRP